MYLNRQIQKEIKNYLFKKKAIIIYGARQTGKTSLVKKIVQETNKSFLWFNADEPEDNSILANQNSSILQSIFGNNEIIVIDEAQRISNIGLLLKRIIDTFPQYQLIATGSSSFDLANKINEPLTGRKWEYNLYPFSFAELANHFGTWEELKLLEHRLIFGMYPDVALNSSDAKKTVKTLANSYLYKDILTFDTIRHSNKIIKLLKALALQVGSEVSYHELGQLVELDSKTVEKYIDILEQSYIVFRLNSYSNNLRTELKKAKKIYFFDNGIRNAVIGNYQLVSNRNDIGQLWENFIISERFKYIKYNDLDSQLFFWRTKSQQEIDLIEINNSEIKAYELKWNPKIKRKIPKSFVNAYPNAKFELINRENYIQFLR